MNFSVYKYYIGCECSHDDGKPKIFTSVMYDQIIQGIISTPRLHLKSVRDMSNEDSIFICRALFPKHSQSAGDDHLAKTGRRVMVEYFFGKEQGKSIPCPFDTLITVVFPYLIDHFYDLFFTTKTDA